MIIHIEKEELVKLAKLLDAAEVVFGSADYHPAFEGFTELAREMARKFERLLQEEENRHEC